MPNLSKRLEKALNEQIVRELESAYIYLSMCAYFEAQNLRGMAHWMRLQAQEELRHAMKIFDFVNDRGGRVELGPIAKPPIDFKSPLDAFQKALAHEQKITQCINDLYDLADDEDDYPTEVMLQWFIDEQVEEEKSASEIVEQLKLVSDNGAGLLVLDQKLGQREEEDEE
ncbi:MAG: ferritin [Candidatus Bipolaricaulota bacterium]|nr:ferritin [Candidatus Bipolaricaulota bacterium]MDW8031636.1 ferritin [Candidatus Bipolaricaulota bacterium]